MGKRTELITQKDGRIVPTEVDAEDKPGKPVASPADTRPELSDTKRRKPRKGK